MNENGYTVLEALIAFAILSTVLVALYAAAGTSLHAVDAAARSRRVALLAQSKLDEIAALRDPLPADSRGVFPGSDVHWEMTATELGPTRTTERAPRMQTIHLTLTWPRDGRLQSVAVETRHLGVVRP